MKHPLNPKMAYSFILLALLYFSSTHGFLSNNNYNHHRMEDEHCITDNCVRLYSGFRQVTLDLNRRTIDAGPALGFREMLQNRKSCNVREDENTRHIQNKRYNSRISEFRHVQNREIKHTSLEFRQQNIQKRDIISRSSQQSSQERKIRDTTEFRQLPIEKREIRDIKSGFGQLSIKKRVLRDSNSGFRQQAIQKREIRDATSSFRQELIQNRDTTRTTDVRSRETTNIERNIQSNLERESERKTHSKARDTRNSEREILDRQQTSFQEKRVRSNDLNREPPLISREIRERSERIRLLNSAQRENRNTIDSFVRSRNTERINNFPERENRVRRVRTSLEQGRIATSENSRIRQISENAQRNRIRVLPEQRFIQEHSRLSERESRERAEHYSDSVSRRTRRNRELPGRTFEEGRKQENRERLESRNTETRNARILESTNQRTAASDRKNQENSDRRLSNSNQIREVFSSERETREQSERIAANRRAVVSPQKSREFASSEGVNRHASERILNREIGPDSSHREQHRTLFETESRDEQNREYLIRKLNNLARMTGESRVLSISRQNGVEKREIRETQVRTDERNREHDIRREVREIEREIRSTERASQRTTRDEDQSSQNLNRERSQLSQNRNQRENERKSRLGMNMERNGDERTAINNGFSEVRERNLEREVTSIRREFDANRKRFAYNEREVRRQTRQESNHRDLENDTQRDNGRHTLREINERENIREINERNTLREINNRNTLREMNSLREVNARNIVPNMNERNTREMNDRSNVREDRCNSKRERERNGVDIDERFVPEERTTILEIKTRERNVRENEYRKEKDIHERKSREVNTNERTTLREQENRETNFRNNEDREDMTIRGLRSRVENVDRRRSLRERETRNIRENRNEMKIREHRSDYEQEKISREREISDDEPRKVSQRNIRERLQIDMNNERRDANRRKRDTISQADTRMDREETVRERDVTIRQRENNERRISNTYREESSENTRERQDISRKRETDERRVRNINREDTREKQDIRRDLTINSQHREDRERGNTFDRETVRSSRVDRERRISLDRDTAQDSQVGRERGITFVRNSQQIEGESERRYVEVVMSRERESRKGKDNVRNTKRYIREKETRNQLRENGIRRELSSIRREIRDNQEHRQENVERRQLRMSDNGQRDINIRERQGIREEGERRQLRMTKNRQGGIDNRQRMTQNRRDIEERQEIREELEKRQLRMPEHREEERHRRQNQQRDNNIRQPQEIRGEMERRQLRMTERQEKTTSRIEDRLARERTKVEREIRVKDHQRQFTNIEEHKIENRERHIEDLVRSLQRATRRNLDQTRRIAENRRHSERTTIRDRRIAQNRESFSQIATLERDMLFPYRLVNTREAERVDDIRGTRDVKNNEINTFERDNRRITENRQGLSQIRTLNKEERNNRLMDIHLLRDISDIRETRTSKNREIAAHGKENRINRVMNIRDIRETFDKEPEIRNRISQEVFYLDENNNEVRMPVKTENEHRRNFDSGNYMATARMENKLDGDFGLLSSSTFRAVLVGVLIAQMIFKSKNNKIKIPFFNDFASAITGKVY